MPTRSIGIELDAVPVRIVEIERFADMVVGSAGQPSASSTRPDQRRAQMGAVGEQPCHMKQAGGVATRRGAGMLDQCQCRLEEAEPSGPRLVVEEHQADCISVEGDRPIEMADGQSNVFQSHDHLSGCHVATGWPPA